MNDIGHPQLDPVQSSPKKEENFVFEVLKIFLIALVIVAPIRLFIAQPFVVSGASMEPTFEDKEYLIVDQVSYALENPSRGDVVIFRFPLDPSKFFIKRIVGLPNETVELRDHDIIIANSENPDGMILDESYILPENQASDYLTVTLKEHEYFVMGDNRKDSSDSRIWGVLQKDLIVGRAFLRLAPPSRISLFPGQ